MTFWKRLFKRSLFRGKAVIPSSRFMILVLFNVFATTISAWWGWGWLFFFLLNGILVGLVIIDLWLLRKLPDFSASRSVEELFEIKEDNQVNITLTTNKPAYTQMWLRDDYPHGFQVSQRTIPIKWSGETSQTVSYQARPHRRGRHRFESIHIRMESSWKLIILQEAFSVSDEVKVYPRLESLRKVRKGYYRKQTLADETTRIQTFGAGHEFSHIREYIPDDDPRNINWMGTARIGKLVSNVYQPESGQQVAILLDCGRLMGIQNDGQSQLDRSLEAALGYAAIALQRGDRVSFLAFSDRILRWVPLDQGMSHIQKIIEACYDLEAGYVESDYLLPLDFIRKFHRNKTLVTLFTDAANIAFSETMSPFISRVMSKHLILTVSMQDPRLKDLRAASPKMEEDIYRNFVIDQFQEERRQVLKQWNHKKVVTLDVEPQYLASAVILSYLEIRARLER
ncbi:DUF58 domain-containing protein [Hazenella coriacea]|uniref:Uncharacterized protein (DUF58 family) n=1 Tax=Hazenella coriacea TaxID=1179467 RepID=A0A4R3L2R7_9BACL|nr:DUF58 domain-containing protein [Hazenella coriacea]TCS93873.1 uncharacterized protein (DUF58 family) [Hazenella coriacea]